MCLSSLALSTSKNAKLPKVMSMTNSWILLLNNIFYKSKFSYSLEKNGRSQDWSRKSTK